MESSGRAPDGAAPGPAGVAGTALSATARSRSTWLLIAVRTAYAYNWFDIGPAFPRIGLAFGVGPAAWGLLTAAFLAGAGALQVPAGLLARRYGPRGPALGGAGLLAAAALGSALAPSFPLLLLARAVAGAGAGLFFSPAIGLVASLYPPGARGLPVGGFSSSFSAGAALGLYGSALLVPAVDWRVALALGALVLAAVTAAAAVAVPRGAGAPSPAGESTPSSRSVSRTLLHPKVWAIGLAFVGIEGAAFATGQFVVPFGETIHEWAPAVAGAVATAFVLPSVLGGPLGGALAERDRRHRSQLALATLVGAGALALLPWAGLAGAVAIGSVFSFSYGLVYAVMYVAPLFWTDVPSSEVPLAIGLFNGLELGGGAAVSFAFGWVVAARSYAAAWEVAAAIQALTLVALLAWPRGDRRPAEAPVLP